MVGCELRIRPLDRELRGPTVLSATGNLIEMLTLLFSYRPGLMIPNKPPGQFYRRDVAELGRQEHMCSTINRAIEFHFTALAPVYFHPASVFYCERSGLSGIADRQTLPCDSPKAQAFALSKTLRNKSYWHSC